MAKSLFTDNKGNLHYGDSAPEGFTACTEEQVKTILSKGKGKKFWRCTVCNDLHFGEKPPKECPTCHVVDAYIEIDKSEFMAILGIN